MTAETTNPILDTKKSLFEISGNLLGTNIVLNSEQIEKVASGTIQDLTQFLQEAQEKGLLKNIGNINNDTFTLALFEDGRVVITKEEGSGQKSTVLERPLSLKDIAHNARTSDPLVGFFRSLLKTCDLAARLEEGVVSQASTKEDNAEDENLDPESKFELDDDESAPSLPLTSQRTVPAKALPFPIHLTAEKVKKASDKAFNNLQSSFVRNDKSLFNTVFSSTRVDVISAIYDTTGVLRNGIQFGISDLFNSFGITALSKSPSTFILRGIQGITGCYISIKGIIENISKLKEAKEAHDRVLASANQTLALLNAFVSLASAVMWLVVGVVAFVSVQALDICKNLILFSILFPVYSIIAIISAIYDLYKAISYRIKLNQYFTALDGPGEEKEKLYKVLKLLQKETTLTQRQKMKLMEEAKKEVKKENDGKLDKVQLKAKIEAKLKQKFLHLERMVGADLVKKMLGKDPGKKDSKGAITEASKDYSIDTLIGKVNANDFTNAKALLNELDRANFNKIANSALTILLNVLCIVGCFAPMSEIVGIIFWMFINVGFLSIDVSKVNDGYTGLLYKIAGRKDWLDKRLTKAATTATSAPAVVQVTT